MLELQPPDIEILTPPKPVVKVENEQANRMIRLNEVTLSLLDEKVEDFVKAVLTEPTRSEAFQDKVEAIHALGNAEIRAAAKVSNRFLERPVSSMNNGLFDSKSQVSKTLVDLRKVVEDLDPSRQGDLFAPKKLFGLIPLGNRVRDYFLRYQSSQQHLSSILEKLYNGQTELRKDNATIKQEKVKLWETMEKLEQYIYLAKKLDGALEARVGELESEDPEKARIVEEEMLFYVRQKVQDLQTQLAVSIQGYLALDMVRKNNLELIKGVDRASTTTVSALRTAVMVSQGLANQKLVLDQIKALNQTTGNLIESTSDLLTQQSADVNQQASSSTVDVQKLQKAFSNVYAAMDAISSYKVAALATMKQTVEILSVEIDKAKTYLDQERRAQPEAIDNLPDDRYLPAPSDELNL